MSVGPAGIILVEMKEYGLRQVLDCVRVDTDEIVGDDFLCCIQLFIVSAKILQTVNSAANFAFIQSEFQKHIAALPFQNVQ
jgi:hypothetical protein